MTIATETDARIGLTNTLLRQYPRMSDEQTDELMRLLGNQETEAVAGAIDKHALSSEGRFPPQAGQLLEHIRSIDAATKRKVVHVTHRGQKVAVHVPENLRKHFGNTETIEVYAVRCQECGDTGMARFYCSYDESRVYTATDALKLSHALFEHLRVTRAVCDCDAGIGHPARNVWTSVKGYDMAVYPRLEMIRRMSHQQRRRERQEIGA